MEEEKKKELSGWAWFVQLFAGLFGSGNAQPATTTQPEQKGAPSIVASAANEASKEPERNGVQVFMESIKALEEKTKTNDAVFGPLDEYGLPVSGPLAAYARKLIDENKTANGQLGLFQKRQELAETIAKREVYHKHDGELSSIFSMAMPDFHEDEIKQETQKNIEKFDKEHPEYAKQINDRYTEAVKKAGKEFEGKLKSDLEYHGVKLETIIALDGNKGTLTDKGREIAAEVASGSLDQKLQVMGTSLRQMAINDGNKDAVTPAELESALSLAATVNAVKEQSSR